MLSLQNTVANSAIPVSLSNKKGAAVSSIVISSSKVMYYVHNIMHTTYYVLHTDADIVRSSSISACYLYPYVDLFAVMPTVYDHMSLNTLH